MRLDAAQQAAVEAGCRPGGLLVVGGPGSGKTSIAVEILSRLVASVDVGTGVGQCPVVGLAARQPLARALATHVSRRSTRAFTAPVVRTLHGFAVDCLGQARHLLGLPPVHALPASDYDRFVRQLLQGDAQADAAVLCDEAVPAPAVEQLLRWPREIQPALRSPAFAQQVRDVLARCAQAGVGASDIARLAQRHAHPLWAGLARFAQQTEQVRALAHPHHYPLAQVVPLLVRTWQQHPQVLQAQRQRLAALVVDDAQAVDAAGWQLLRLLAHPGIPVVAFADPDQAVDAFRGAVAFAGAQVQDLWGLPTRRLVLPSSYRLNASAAQAVAPLTSRPAMQGRGQGRLHVQVMSSADEQWAVLVGHLRACHQQGLEWRQMAVVARRRAQLAQARQVLAAAAIPSTGQPLTSSPLAHPVVEVLVDLARWAVAGDEVSQWPDEAALRAILTSPLVGADALALRRVQIWSLRQGNSTTGLQAVFTQAGEGQGEPPPLVSQVRQLVRGAAQVAQQGASVEQVLWQLWSASGVAVRLQTATQVRPGDALWAAQAAHHSLDAAVEIFALARDHGPAPALTQLPLWVEKVKRLRLPRSSNRSVGVGGGLAPDAVTVVTAHGCVGRQWSVVHVVEANRSCWPDTRPAQSLLDASWLLAAASGQLHSTDAGSFTAGLRRAVVQQERRLFTLALTRASAMTVVTAVDNQAAQERPSRFLDDLQSSPGSDQEQVVSGSGRQAGRSCQSLELAPDPSTVVAQLRQALVRAQRPDPAGEGTDSPADAAALAGLLARLAQQGIGAAHPAHWYAAHRLSDSRPLQPDPQVPVVVSPSTVEAFQRCPLRWLAESIGARPAQSLHALHLGTALHAVAAVADELLAQPDGEQQVRQVLDQALASVPWRTGWAGRAQREQAEQAFQRLRGWIRSRDPSLLVGTELPFSVQVGTAVVRGRVDRLERDAQGKALVVDVKTGGTAPSAAEVKDHPQLGMYQLAVQEGGFESNRPGLTTPGGAMLVQVGPGAGATGVAKEQSQPSLASSTDPRWPYQMLAQTAQGIAGGQFPAVRNSTCRTCPVRLWCPAYDQPAMLGLGEGGLL